MIQKHNGLSVGSVGPNLGVMTVHHGTIQMLTPRHRMRRRQALFKRLLIHTFTKRESTLVFNVSNALNYSVLNKY